MSDLQIGLILIGVVLILAVVVFNWWQDRRLHKAMLKQFPEHENDPLMADSYSVGTAPRMEPGLDKLIDNTNSTNNGTEPESEAESSDAEEVDPTTEVVIDINFAQPIDSVQLLEALKNLHKASAKPIRLFAETEGGVHRSKFRAGDSYSSIQLAVLLANRSGPLTDIEWSKLWAFAQGVADRLDGSLEGPEYNLVVQKAQALDKLCAELDAQVGIVLQLVKAHPSEKVITALQKAGFVEKNSNLVWPSDNDAACFTVLFNGLPLANLPQSNVSTIDFVLDLPNSPPYSQAFSRMANVARLIATELGATVLDDNNDPLPENSDTVIDKQLNSLYERLEQAGYSAGEARTMRIFS